MKTIDTYKLKAAGVELDQFDYFSNKDNHDYMEVIEWMNGEGFDVTISANSGNQMFSLTHGQFRALKKLIKELNKPAE